MKRFVYQNWILLNLAVGILPLSALPFYFLFNSLGVCEPHAECWINEFGSFGLFGMFSTLPLGFGLIVVGELAKRLGFWLDTSRVGVGKSKSYQTAFWVVHGLLFLSFLGLAILTRHA